eukprot:5424923-Pleurochrysis_carterae.AAC.3
MMGNSHPSASIETELLRAEVCINAVRKPVGYVKPASQNTLGTPLSHQSKSCCQRWIRSRDHEASGLSDG